MVGAPGRPESTKPVLRQCQDSTRLNRKCIKPSAVLALSWHCLGNGQPDQRPQVQLQEPSGVESGWRSLGAHWGGLPQGSARRATLGRKMASSQDAPLGGPESHYFAARLPSHQAAARTGAVRSISTPGLTLLHALI